MILKNFWYVAAWSRDVTRNFVERVIAEEFIVIFRKEDGTAVALENRCPHRNLPLGRGRLIGDRVQCGYHGLTFDTDGRCVHAPGEDKLPAWARVRSYPVTERHGWLFVWLGDPERADPETVPQFQAPLADPEWAAVTGQSLAQCGYRMILDNLLDLSHLAYVHNTTTGNAALAENAKIETQANEQSVRVTRTMEDVAPAPAFIEFGGYSRDRNLNRWQVTNFYPPSFIFINNGSTTSDKPIKDQDHHTSQGQWGYQVYHAITPATETTTHLFWALTYPKRFVADHLAEKFRQLQLQVIDEDLTVYEAQQTAIAADRSATSQDVNPKGALKVDDGLLKARMMIRRLHAQEEKSRTAAGHAL